MPHGCGRAAPAFRRSAAYRLPPSLIERLSTTRLSPAAWLAMRVGLWLAAEHYPNRAGTGAPFPQAPVLESTWVIIAQPFGVAVTYCLTTAWNGAADLRS